MSVLEGGCMVLCRADDIKGSVKDCELMKSSSERWRSSDVVETFISPWQQAGDRGRTKAAGSATEARLNRDKAYSRRYNWRSENLQIRIHLLLAATVNSVNTYATVHDFLNKRLHGFSLIRKLFWYIVHLILIYIPDKS